MVAVDSYLFGETGTSQLGDWVAANREHNFYSSPPAPKEQPIDRATVLF
jgi:hypothetical protein